jgi:nucleoside-diphosphate kinase
MEKTLVLLKPDCVQRRLVGAIIQRFEQKGLCLVGLKILQASKELAEAHYAVHKNRHFYKPLLKFIMSGPLVAIVLEGPEAVSVVRNMMGPTDGTKAAPSTVRGDYALNVQNNLIHGSDAPENAEVEIKIWFRHEELVAYHAADEPWVLGSGQ